MSPQVNRGATGTQELECWTRGFDYKGRKALYSSGSSTMIWLPRPYSRWHREQETVRGARNFWYHCGQTFSDDHYTRLVSLMKKIGLDNEAFVWKPCYSRILRVWLCFRLRILTPLFPWGNWKHFGEKLRSHKNPATVAYPLAFINQPGLQNPHSKGWQ